MATVVHDSADDGTLSAELGRRGGPTTGAAVVHPVPGSSRPQHLAADLLMALGKGFDALEREGFADHSWQLARLWIRAEKTRHLVVLDADRLPALLWTLLGELARSAQLRLWLVVHRPIAQARLAALGRWRSRAPGDLLDALPPAATAPQGAEGQADRAQARAARLRRVVTPACACGLALAAVAGLDTNTLVALDLRNVDGAARWLSVGGRRVPIPAELRGLVRAQLLCRAAVEAARDDPLFAGPFRMRASPALFTEWLRQATSQGPIRREEPWLDGPRVYGRVLLIRGEPRRIAPAYIGPLVRDSAY